MDGVWDSLSGQDWAFANPPTDKAPRFQEGFHSPTPLMNGQSVPPLWSRVPAERLWVWVRVEEEPGVMPRDAYLWEESSLQMFSISAEG